MKKISIYLILAFIFLFPLLLFAQKTELSNNSHSITIEELKDHLYFLASDELNGRLPGSIYYDIATDYAIRQFKQAGLKPICFDSSGNKNFRQMIYFQKYAVSQNDSMVIEINGKKKVFSYPDDYTYENLVQPLQESVSGKVVFVGYGLNEPGLNWNDFEGINLKDKWILMFYELSSEYIEDLKIKLNDSGKSIEDILRKRNDFIANSEVKGVIYIVKEDWLNTFDNWAYLIGMKYIITDNKFQHRNDIGKPWISVRTDFLNQIFEGEKFDPVNNIGKYQTYELTNSKITLHKEYVLQKVKSQNIVAYVEGSDSILKNEFVLLGAHLDHLGIKDGNIMNGADDNASGCAALLEIAKAVALSKPKRSVAFILFTVEENGILGSKYFVEHSPINPDSMQLFVNLDMIGRSDGKASDISPVGYNSGSVNMRDLLNKINGGSIQVNIDYEYADTTDLFTKSDQIWFYNMGIPVIHFSDGLHNDYHTTNDDVEKIDFEFMRNVSFLTYNLIMEVANSEIKLRKE